MRKSILLAVMIVGTLGVQRGDAGVIIQPTAFLALTDDAGDPIIPTDGSGGLTRDQSGLSASYVSGVDLYEDVVTNVATRRSHDYGGVGTDNSLLYDQPSGAGSLATVDYDLGASFLLGNFALWNTSFTAARAVNQFDLIISPSLDFATDGVTVITDATASNSVAPIVANNIDFANSFSFAPTSGRYARLVIDSNYGDNLTAFGEVAFGVAVPEASEAAILMAGTFGLLVHRRRKRRGGVA